MSKHNPGADLHEPFGFGSGGILDADAERGSRPPQQRRIADGLGGGEKEEQLRLLRQRAVAVEERFLDSARQRHRSQHGEAAREIGGGETARQLEQCERIPARFGDDPVDDAGVDATGEHRHEQCPAVDVGQAADDQFGKPREIGNTKRFARTEQQGDRFRTEPPRDKGQCPRRRLIEPLRVIDHTQQGLVGRDLRQQVERGQPDDVPVRRLADVDAEHDTERVRLRRWKALDAVEHPPAQLVQRRVRQFHLRFHARRPRYREPMRSVECVVEQGGLADPCLPAQHERPALAATHVGEDIVERPTLFASTAQLYRLH